MAYKIATEDRGDYLYISITGEVYSGTAKALAREVLEAYAQKPMSRLLVDVTRASIEVDSPETVSMVSDYRNLSQGFPSMTAVLYDRSDAAILRFYETVATNRGYTSRIFTDAQAAIDWLSSSPQ